MTTLNLPKKPSWVSYYLRCAFVLCMCACTCMHDYVCVLKIAAIGEKIAHLQIYSDVRNNYGKWAWP